jgi:hypothetical protein
VFTKLKKLLAGFLLLPLLASAQLSAQEGPLAFRAPAAGSVLRVARNPRGFPTTSGYLVKFNPGDYAASYEIYNSYSQYAADISVLAANPIPNQSFQGYVIGMTWGTTENGTAASAPSNPSISQAQIRTDYPGFVKIETMFNALQTSIPGARAGLYFTAPQYSAVAAASISGYNFDQSGYYLPHYINSCGGSLTIPNSYTSSSTTTYNVDKVYSGSSYYGMLLSWGGGASYTIWPDLANPGVMQAWINFWQAFSLFKMNITAGPLAGQSLTWDQCSLCEFVNDNSEVSVNAHDNPSGYSFSPAPQTAYSTGKTQFWSQYGRWATAIRSFFPHTSTAGSLSFGWVGGDNSYDTNAQLAGRYNNILSGSGVSANAGFVMSGADTNANDWLTPTATANAFKQGFAGIASPATPTLPAVNPSDSLVNVSPYDSQVQPADYYYNNPSGITSETQGMVLALVTAMNNSYIGANRRIWAMGDYTQTGGSNTGAWSGYIRPALVTNSTSANSTRPSTLP